MSRGPIGRDPFSERELAERLGSRVDVRVAPGDALYAGDMRQYLRVAYSGLRCVNLSLAAAGAGEPGSILDLPCGHGRVMRVLRLAFPAAEIWGADFDRSAVDFCASHFDATPIQAAPDPAAMAIHRSFDLIWCGSLLTQLDASRSMEFLAFLQSRLNPAGVAVFTTHGEAPVRWLEVGHFDYGLDPARAAKALAEYRSSGFGWTEHPRGGGVSLASPAWMIDAIARIGGWRLAAFFPRAWDGHHDVWACVRD